MEKQNTTIDELAGMVAKGFNNIQDQFIGFQGQFHQKLEQELGPIKEDIQELKTGMEEIKLKLDNVAYRFELVELQRRVELLEKKTGIK